jgi:CBS domain-containing protein
MLRLRDIMTRDVLTVTPSTSLQEAAELLAVGHMSGAPVVEGGRLVGVVSLSDIVGFAAAAPSDADWTEDGDGENPDDWSAEAAWEDEPSARYFTDRSAEAGLEVTDHAAEPRDPAWSLLAAHTVSEVMTRGVRALPPESLVSAAAARMRTADVHRILVVDDDGALHGIVTTTDITRAVADGRLVRRTFVFGPPHPTRQGRGPR